MEGDGSSSTADVERTLSISTRGNRERVRAQERRGACHYTRVNAGISTQVLFDQLLSMAAQVKAIQPKLGSSFAKPHIGDVGAYPTFPILYINCLSPNKSLNLYQIVGTLFPQKKKKKLFLVFWYVSEAVPVTFPLNH